MPVTRERGVEPALVLLGPTASGKTALALAVAPALGAEIVSVDSRQVYRGMDIGTAKPSPEERARVPHHLLDIIDPGEPYSAGRFRDDALAACRDIRARGLHPILAGGTGLYFDALLRGLAPVPPRDDAVRAEIERRADREGTEALHAALLAADPPSAARIHPHDRVRLVRALEILALGGPPSAFRTWGGAASGVAGGEASAESGVAGGADAAAGGCGAADTVMIGLAWDRARLYERIEARLAAMVRAGFVAEVARLGDAGYGARSPGFRTPGYREILAHLEGRLALPEALAATARATRRLARRQIQWFRPRTGIVWLDGSLPVDELAADVLARWRSALDGGCRSSGTA